MADLYAQKAKEVADKQEEVAVLQKQKALAEAGLKAQLDVGRERECIMTALRCCKIPQALENKLVKFNINDGSSSAASASLVSVESDEAAQETWNQIYSQTQTLLTESTSTTPLEVNEIVKSFGLLTKFARISLQFWHLNDQSSCSVQKTHNSVKLNSRRKSSSSGGSDSSGNSATVQIMGTSSSHKG